MIALLPALAMLVSLPKPVATPFDLGDVRLLPGPFETAHMATANYLLELEPERLLAGFRANSGLQPKGEIYGGWETGGLSGHSLGHYLTACAQEYARTKNVAFRDKALAIVTGLAECQVARPDGFLMAFRFEKGFDRARLDKIWAEVAKGEIRTGGFDLNGMWSPWYVHHKVLQGLLDVQLLCGDRKALGVAEHFADWMIAETKSLTDEQWQKMLGCEYGGMNESLATLFQRTKKAKYLDLARKFYDTRVLDPLVAGKDELGGKHSNTQIPKLIGLATLFELTGKEADAKAAKFFWETVVANHTYAIGGNSNGEYLGPPRQLSDRLSSNTCETCNTYNMLKLTRQLFAWQPSAKLMDYYEQAYFNHILASQDPATAGVTYFMPLATGGHRQFSGKFDDFTCCHGTGMENHTKHADSAFFHSGKKSLWVNLFVNSELSWKQAGVELRLTTDFPTKGNVSIEILKGRGAFEILVRHPGWAAGPIAFAVGGKVVATSSNPGEYVSIRRSWKAGEKLVFSLPMPLREIPMPDNAKRVALAHGPIVLAADLGPARGPAPRIPVLVPNDRPIAEWLRPSADGKAFEVAEIARPDKLTFRPFYAMGRNRYGVYFDKFTQDEWTKAESEYRAEEARLKDLQSRTLDQVTIGEMQPERDHNLKSERNDVRDVNGRSFRTAMPSGWFEFDLKIDSSKQNSLVLTYWGNDRLKPDFTILVDGAELAKEQLVGRPMNRFFDVEYVLPMAVTSTKPKVVIRIQPSPNRSGPSVARARKVQTQ